MGVRMVALAHDERSRGCALGNLSPAAPDFMARTLSGLAVTRLNLTDYRNIRHLRLESEARVVVLSGPNGAGKTNILEALSFLSPGRGLRRARLSDVTRRGSTGMWAVAVRLRDSEGMVEIGTGLAPTEQGAERRVVKVDGQVVRGTAALSQMVVVNWLTPQMDRLFIEGPGPRRRFLDRLVYGFDTEHAPRVSAYERAMRERSQLLRTGRDDAAWLTALEETMATYGVAVAAARREAIARLAGAMEASVSPFPRAQVGADGDLERWLDDMPAVDAEVRFREALEMARGRDAQTGGAMSGPHRTEFAVHHAEKDMPAAECSTGEQKALLVSIVLSDARLQEARLGRAPLLLFDEVAAHLDAARREALFELISARSAQTWITGTDASLFVGLGQAAQYFDVDDGRIAQRTD